VRHRLRRIDQDDCTGRVRGWDDAIERRDRPERVADLRECDQLHAA